MIGRNLNESRLLTDHLEAWISGSSKKGKAYSGGQGLIGIPTIFVSKYSGEEAGVTVFPVATSRTNLESLTGFVSEGGVQSEHSRLEIG